MEHTIFPLHVQGGFIVTTKGPHIISVLGGETVTTVGKSKGLDKILLRGKNTEDSD